MFNLQMHLHFSLIFMIWAAKSIKSVPLDLHTFGSGGDGVRVISMELLCG